MSKKRAVSVFPIYSGESDTFIAYIGELQDRLKIAAPNFIVRDWREQSDDTNFVPFRVLRDITSARYILFDATKLTNNTVFELGYSIAKSKSILFFFMSDEHLSSQSSFFHDIIGNFELLQQPHTDIVLPYLLGHTLRPFSMKTYSGVLKHDAFILLPDQPQREIDHLEKEIRTRLSGFSVASFDPRESHFLPLEDCMHVAHGALEVILPFWRFGDPAFFEHNLRCSFLFGLRYGLEKSVRPIIIDGSGRSVPIDYRPIVRSISLPHQYAAFAGDLAISVHEQKRKRSRSGRDELLRDLDLGRTAAENEETDLKYYFLRTESYDRLLRGDARLVVGRKGSGKTALFLMISQKLSESGDNVIIPLQPPEYQLKSIKAALSSIAQSGVKEFVLVALWEYLLIRQIASYALVSDKKFYYRTDGNADIYLDLLRSFPDDAAGVSQIDLADDLGECVDRMNAMKVEEIKKFSSTSAQMLFGQDIPMLRESLARYLKTKKEVRIVVDGIDKGWNPYGVDDWDLAILRALLEAARKVEKLFQQAKINFRSAVFVRNDVYENLLNATPDRGKDFEISVDWTDRDLLKEIVRLRIVRNGLPRDTSLAVAWDRICVREIEGRPTVDVLIDHSLMRPRVLLDLLGYCRTNAINHGRTLIEEQDVEKGLDRNANLLFRALRFELKDILGSDGGVINRFVDWKLSFSDSELLGMIDTQRGKKSAAKVADCLCWYGFLGILRSEDHAIFIYDVDYDMERFKRLAEVQNSREGGLNYRVNHGFHRALQMD